MSALYKNSLLFPEIEKLTLKINVLEELVKIKEDIIEIYETHDFYLRGSKEKSITLIDKKLPLLWVDIKLELEFKNKIPKDSLDAEVSKIFICFLKIASFLILERKPQGHFSKSRSKDGRGDNMLHLANGLYSTAKNIHTKRKSLPIEAKNKIESILHQSAHFVAICEYHKKLLDINRFIQFELKNIDKVLSKRKTNKFIKRLIEILNEVGLKTRYDIVSFRNLINKRLKK